MVSVSEENGWTVISYSRKDALEDGVLIDITDIAKEYGFKFHTAISENLYHSYIVPSSKQEKKGQSTSGRLHDVMWLGLCEIRKALGANKSRVTFKCAFRMDGGKIARPEIIFDIGPGDQGEPVITIMLPEDD